VYLIKITNHNHIEYSILIQAIIELKQMMHKNEHHMYLSFDIHDLNENII